MVVASLGHRFSGVPPKAEKASMYTVYIIESIVSKKRYIGVTSDIIKRLHHHNSGANRSTRNKGPWKVIYTEEYDSKETAWLREKKIKSYKGGVAFKKLIGEV